MKALRYALFALPFLALAACMLARPNPEADTSTTRRSERGTYEVTYRPAVTPIPKRELHEWTIEIHDSKGRPVDGAKITVDGGMPYHGHGLPTQPAVSQELGGGAYVVDGVKFNMGGYWVVDLAIASAAGEDKVRFELNL